MKNILGSSTPRNLHGRLKYSTQYVCTNYLYKKKLLDIGCGFGWFLVHGLNSKASFVAGMEQTETDLAIAFADPKLSQNADLKVGSGIDIPYENCSFDVITSWEVLEHIPKKTESIFFKEINRVLSLEGHFFLSTPNESPLCTYLDPAYWLVSHRHYSINSIRDYAETHGFEVEDIRLCGRWYETLAIYNLYISKWIFRREPFFENWQNLKMDKEWNGTDGFMTIMARLRKVSDT